MKTITLITLSLLLAVAAAAQTPTPTQTTISTTQIVAPVTSNTSKATITIALPSGVLSQATLGEGITVDLTTVPPTLKVTVPAPTPVITLTQKLLTLNPVDLTITANGIILLMRNGVTLLEGTNADYVRTLTGVKIMKQPTMPGDQWSCLCN